MSTLLYLTHGVPVPIVDTDGRGDGSGAFPQVSWHHQFPSCQSEDDEVHMFGVRKEEDHPILSPASNWQPYRHTVDNEGQQNNNHDKKETQQGRHKEHQEQYTVLFCKEHMNENPVHTSQRNVSVAMVTHLFLTVLGLMMKVMWLFLDKPNWTADGRKLGSTSDVHWIRYRAITTNQWLMTSNK